MPQAWTWPLGTCACCQQPSPGTPPAVATLPFPRLGQVLAEAFTKRRALRGKRKRKDWWWCPGLTRRGWGQVRHLAGAAVLGGSMGQQLLSQGTMCTLCDSKCWLGRVRTAHSDFFFSSRSQQKRPQFWMPKVSIGSVTSFPKGWLLLTLAGCFALSDFVGNVSHTLSMATVGWRAESGAALVMLIGVQ